MFRSSKINRLADLLDDPVVDLVMKSDGVDRRSLDLLFERVRHGRMREPVRVDGPIAC
ncbi:MAG TPA: hypothetical protein VGR91_08445 [Stellaceae bacterium]|nr:hypothetical protein [Stellaceae bacterium]